LKILHICQFLGIGGLEKVLYLLIKEQIKFGHKVSIVVYDWEKTWVQKFKDLGIDVYDDYTKEDRYDFNLIDYFSDICPKFDILHTHDLNPMLYVGVLKLKRKLTFRKFPKIVHTTHGMEHIKETPKTRLYEKFLAFTADAIVGVSPTICDYYKNHTTASSKKIFNIDNGTPIQEHLEKNKDIALKKTIFSKFNMNTEIETYVYVARVVPLKDQKILIEIFSNLKNKQLLLVGPSGNEEYWNDVNNHSLKNVYVIGAQDNIDDILKSCDIYISPSHHEGLPISVLEASAAGLPCILSDIPGHKTLTKFTDKEIALYFEVKNKESILKAIDRIEKNNIKETIKENLHRVVYSNYSSHRMFNDYNKIYEAIKC
jgi:glycosyltransferase involved in cell wall biosynthesis